MGSMEPCPECGGKLEATMAPLFGWRCPTCHYVWLAKPKEELNAQELRALLALAEENIEFEGERADKAEAYIKKWQPTIDAFIAQGVDRHAGKWVNHRAEKAEKESAKLAVDKARMDFLFSDQTDVIIVDYGVIGPEPALVLSREHLDRLIEREKPNEGQG